MELRHERRVLAAMMAGVLAAGILCAQAPALRPTRLYVVTNGRMLHGVNPSDATAALRAWFEAVARRKGFSLDCKVDVVDNLGEVKARLRAGQVDVLVPPIADFLELERSHLAVAALVHGPAVTGEIRYPYILLVNRASPATSVADLRGRNVSLYSRGGSNTAQVWIEVLLGQERLGRAASYFGSMKESDRAQSCILPVFFGKVDACVVDATSFHLARELNPQLGSLRVLAQSPPLVENVIATPLQPHRYQQELIDAILSLHEDAAHRQLLMVFRTERVVRPRDGDLAPVRTLWHDYRRLTSGAPPESAAGGN